MGGSYVPKQETLARMSGEYGIPEFRTEDFHSTASMKGSAEQRDEVEPKRDLLPPTILRMESGMPGYATLRGYVWYRKNSHCEISQELSLKSTVISKKPLGKLPHLTEPVSRA